MTVADHSLRVAVSEADVDPAWDEFLADAPGGHHVQISLWAQVKAPSGWRAVRVIATRGGGIVGGAQLLLRPLAFSQSVGYIAKGPVSPPDDPEVLSALFDALQEVMKEHRIRHLTVQPPNNGEALVPHLAERGFRPSIDDVAPSATIRIDLSPSLDDLLGRMKKNHRRSIRLAKREGVTCRIGSEHDLVSFHRLLSMTGQRQGFTPPSLDYFTAMWQILNPVGYLQLFVSEYQGEAVSAQLVVPFGDTVIAKRAGWSGKHPKLGPNHLMDWHTMEWAKAHGYRWYDLEGIERETATHVLQGEPLPPDLLNPALYKLGFRGQVTLYPGAYVQVPNALLRWGGDTVLPMIIDRPAVRGMIDRLRSG